MRLRALYEAAPNQAQASQAIANQVKRAQREADRQAEKQQREADKRRDAHDDAIGDAQKNAERRERDVENDLRDQERDRGDQEKEARDEEHDAAARQGQRIQRRQVREKKDSSATAPGPATRSPRISAAQPAQAHGAPATTTIPTPLYIPTSPQRRAPEAPPQRLRALHFMDRAQLLHRHGWES
jgi:hypothetical protein